MGLNQLLTFNVVQSLFNHGHLISHNPCHCCILTHFARLKCSVGECNATNKLADHDQINQMRPIRQLHA